jgi:GNAT superfamily N-acetyltransferase
MANIHVRGAALDDTTAIRAVWRSHIRVWQRVNAQGQVEDVPYDTLSIYERWLHGGPWMSVETGAIHLSHLLRGAGIPLVAERDGQLVAYAEAYHGVEPAPFVDHLHLAHMTISAGQESSGIEDALLAHLLEQARAYHCKHLMATCIQGDADTDALYRRQGMLPITRLGRLTLPAKSGQGFYKVVESLSSNPEQIADWFMPVGRLGSARQQWETLWPRTWNALPEIAARRTHRIRLSAAGQDAFLYCQEGLYTPRNAEIYLWSPKPLTSQMLTALRDWTHREGYRTLVMVVSDETAKVLSTEAEPDGYYQEVFSVDT